MNREQFTLFYSMPLDATDLRNLRLSAVKRVMIPWSIVPAFPIDEFKRLGLRVIIRMSDEDTKQPNLQRVAQYIAVQYRGMLDGIILGCEPDSGIDWTWGADWQTGKAWNHQAEVNYLLDTIHTYLPAVPAISPGWSQHGYTEVDKPEPGLITWREITTPVYNACDGNAVHIYQHGYSSQLDEIRLLLQVRKWSELRHRPLFIDEFGINEGDEGHRVDCALRFATMMTTAVGERVAMVAPFVSNGIPNGWDSRYLIRSEESYRKIAAFMGGK